MTFVPVAAPLRARGSDPTTDWMDSNLVAHTLTSGADGRAGRRQEDDYNLVAHTLRAEGFDASEDGTGRGTPLVPTLLTMREGKDGGGKGPLVSEDQSLTLATGNGQTLIDGMAVRRLTPVECERLQGFPDGWTAGQKDSARYRQMGNAVAVPVVSWIMDRLVKEDARG